MSTPRLPAEDQCPPPASEVVADNLVGLALSGGGIRSASFNLGVLQGLSQQNVLWIFDYLSTVSGGGFIGAWWSAWLSRQGREHVDLFPPPEQLEGARRDDTAVLWRGTHQPSAQTDARSTHGTPSDPIHFVRLFSNYLTPKRGAFSPDTWRLIAFYVRSLLLTWCALLPLLLAAIIAAQTFYLFDLGASSAFLCSPPEDCTLGVAPRLAHLALFLKILGAAVGTLALLWLAHSSANLALALAGILAVIVTVAFVMAPLSALDSAADWVVILVTVVGIVGWHVGYSLYQWKGAHDAPAKYAGPVHASAADHRAWLTKRLATFLQWGTMIGLLLVVAGFGHDVVRMVVGATRGLPARFGGWGGLTVTLVSAAYTVYKHAPIAAGAGAPKPPGRMGRMLIMIAPPLVLVALAMGFATLGQWLLRTSVASDSAQEIQDRVALMLLVLTVLQVVFAVFEAREVPAGQLRPTLNWRKWLGKVVPFSDNKPMPPTIRAYEIFTPRVWVRLTFLAAVGVILFFLRDGWTDRWARLFSGWDTRLEAGAAVVVLVASVAITFVPDRRNIAPNSARSAALLSAACVSSMLCLLAVCDVAHTLEHGEVFVAFLWIGLLLGTVAALGWLADPNILSLHSFYKARLTRAYLGASNSARDNNPDVTEAVPGDDLKLDALWNHDVGGPYHLVNATLSLVGSSDLATSQRSAENFVMSRYHCGSLRAGYRCTAEYMGGDLSLGTAAAVSGAAVSPTMGSQSISASLALLLSLFNVRLGFWAPNPSGRRWNESHARLWPFYVLRETLSNTGDLRDYCYLTDGGHFDNTGLYALVERGCRYIVVCDCGADPRLGFDDIGVAIRRCRIDFGVEIELHIDGFLAVQKESDVSRTHVVYGEIRYQEEHLRRLGLPHDHRNGIIVWVKPSVTAMNAADVRQYRRTHIDFPQQSTADQWYDESQFESYRKLGYESACDAFGDRLLKPLGKPGNFDGIPAAFAAAAPHKRASGLYDERDQHRPRRRWPSRPSRAHPSRAACGVMTNGPMMSLPHGHAHHHDHDGHRDRRR